MSECVEIKENERIDDLGRRGYRIIQNKDKFCFGVDAALLAWFAKVSEGEKVLDLGTGTGIVPILMKARNDVGLYTALEIQADMAEMATRSVALNNEEESIKIVTGDIKEAAKLFGKATFQVVTTNPPYMKVGRGLQNPDTAKALSRHEIMCTLEDVIRESAAVLEPGGRFYMIHRASRLPEIMRLMNEYRIAPATMYMVHPSIDREATMVLISGTRGGKDILKVCEPIVIYEDEHVYTKQLKKIYDDDYRK